MNRTPSCQLQKHRRVPCISRFVFASLAAVPLVAAADYMKFLKDSPLAHFKGQDYELMQQNANEVLESTEPHAKKEWHNAETGSSGLAEVHSQFTNTDGALCKRLRVFNSAGGFKSDATYAVCKYEGRGWLVHPDAQPAQPPPEKK
jgi:hypothetical protein